MLQRKSVYITTSRIASQICNHFFRCYLNPENGKFIFAFIVPVIVIFIVNCGFFIMAATILWRQQRKHTSDNKTTQIKYM